MEADDLNVGWKLIGPREHNLVIDSFIWVVTLHEIFFEDCSYQSSSARIFFLTNIERRCQLTIFD